MVTELDSLARGIQESSELLEMADEEQDAATLDEISSDTA